MAQHLVSGSYERFVFAHRIPEIASIARQDVSLEKAFAFPAHKGPVKCMAASAPFIASGGADDTVHIYNAKASKDLGFLMNPGEGAVTAVAFYAPLEGSKGPSHLLSGSADGCVAVWAVESDWDCVKTLKGHKKEVTGLSVHPTGLLALSTSRDDMLRMWNMAKGRSQYKTKIPSSTEAVAFSPGGMMYALLSGTKAYAYDVAAEGASTAGVELQSRGMSMSFLAEQTVAIGCENGSLQLLDTRTGAVEQAIEKAHSSRIRGVAAVPARGQSEGAASACVGSASSDGAVKLWDLRSPGAPGRSSEPLCLATTAARLTCLALLDMSSGPIEKRGRAHKAARQVAGHSHRPQKALSSDQGKAGGSDAPEAPKLVRGKLQAREDEGNANSAAADNTKQEDGSKSPSGRTKQRVKAAQGTQKSSLTREQTQAKQDSLKQAELKRKRREELKAAAQAEKGGVLVQKEAEIVVEFPEADRPAKSAKKAKKAKHHRGRTV